MGNLQKRDGHLISKDGHLINDCDCCSPACTCSYLSDPLSLNDATTPYRMELTFGTLTYCTTCQSGTANNSGKIISSSLNGQTISIDFVDACRWEGESTNTDGEDGYHGTVHLVLGNEWVGTALDPDTGCTTDDDHTPDIYHDLGIRVTVRNADGSHAGGPIFAGAFVSIEVWNQQTGNPSDWLAYLFLGQMLLTDFCPNALTGATFTNIFTSCGFTGNTIAGTLEPYPAGSGNLAYNGTVSLKIIPIP
jgi:hypothetical protein